MKGYFNRFGDYGGYDYFTSYAKIYCMEASNQSQTPDMEFIQACTHGDLGQVRSLVRFSGVNIHVSDDLGFKIACENSHREIIDYLLKSPDLAEHVDIHTGEDFAFGNFCFKKNLAMVEHFLYEHDFQINKQLSKDIQEMIYPQEFKPIEDLIAKRNLYHMIDGQLEHRNEVLQIKI